MNYISSNELSKLWGISQGRIIRLAREGRIDGAKKFGKTWLFPADSIKPIDFRTSAGKEVSQSTTKKVKNDSYRFPLFEFRDEKSFSPPLSNEELILKNATEVFHSCEFEKADSILGDLPEKARNKYIRIAAIFTGCMIDMYSCNTRRFHARFEALKAELKKDFPHKAEMVEYLHSIDANLGFNEYYVNEFNINLDYPYHENFIPRLANLSTVIFMFGGKEVSQASLCSHEVNCKLLEGSGFPSELQAVHIFLGSAYAILNMEEKRDQHLIRALRLAERYNMFFNISFHYSYIPSMFENVLKEFSEEFKERLSRICFDVYERSSVFAKSLSPEIIHTSLSSRDYIIFYYGVQGLKNREIAKRLNVSEGTIAKRFSEIYQLLGVNTKAELIQMYKEHYKL